LIVTGTKKCGKISLSTPVAFPLTTAGAATVFPSILIIMTYACSSVPQILVSILPQKLPCHQETEDGDVTLLSQLLSNSQKLLQGHQVKYSSNSQKKARKWAQE